MLAVVSTKGNGRRPRCLSCACRYFVGANGGSDFGAFAPLLEPWLSCPTLRLISRRATLNSQRVRVNQPRRNRTYRFRPGGHSSRVPPPGLVLRLIFFGKPGGAYAAMMVSFIYLCPALVGAVTVYVAERKSRRSWSVLPLEPIRRERFLRARHAASSWSKGLICAIVIVPIFAVIGSVGGLVMGIVCRVTKWPRQTLYSFALLPLLLGGLEGGVVAPSRLGSVERTVLIRAAPDVVWREIMDARDIQPGELKHAWIFRIGVPLPSGGRRRTNAVGTSAKNNDGQGRPFRPSLHGLGRKTEYVQMDISSLSGFVSSVCAWMTTWWSAATTST